MSTQAKALRLADELDAVPETGADPDLIQESAAELRRLAVVGAQRDALLEALKPMIDLAEFWINHRQERRMSEGQYKVWIALGHESNAMLKARAAIKAVEETK